MTTVYAKQNQSVVKPSHEATSEDASALGWELLGVDKQNLKQGTEQEKW